MIEINNKGFLITAIITMTICYIASVVLNYYSMKKSKNNPIQSISSISDKYFTLITPAKITFSIWGIIYILGTVVIVSLWKLVFDMDLKTFNSLFFIILSFIGISILNPLWIYSWINEKIFLSWIVMVMMFILLAITVVKLESIDNQYTRLLYIFFSIYLAWISVALSVNTASLLISKGVIPFDSTAVFLAGGLISIISLITIYSLIVKGNIIFGFVIIWALIGIYLQNDPRVVDFKAIKMTILIWLCILGISMSYSLLSSIKNIPTK